MKEIISLSLKPETVDHIKMLASIEGKKVSPFIQKWIDFLVAHDLSDVKDFESRCKKAGLL